MSDAKYGVFTGRPGRKLGKIWRVSFTPLKKKQACFKDFQGYILKICHDVGMIFYEGRQIEPVEK